MNRWKKWLAEQSTTKRVENANLKIKKISKLISESFEVHESNHFLWSSMLGKQITRSHGAHAFNRLRDSQIRFEIIRLCSYWDRESEDRASFPTILALLDDDDVLKTVIAERGRYETYGWDGNHQVYLGNLLSRDASIEKRRARARLKSARKIVNEVRSSREYRSLVRFRDRHIAHNLTIATTPQNHLPVYHADIKWLLRKTELIINALSLGVCGTSGGWTEAKQIFKQNAKSFWSAVKIGPLT